jgi:4-diphosphocytidyl-2-C-methyl-D-erythritol kinase
MIDTRTITIQSPAKVNLGLEILSRREDGFHELRSVLSMVDITDELRFSFTSGIESSRIDGVPGVTFEDNLIGRAIEAFDASAGTAESVDVRVTKNIPAAAGLGGASSNAAATLIAMNHLHDSPLPHDKLLEVAATLGSDVPFFLGAPTASVSGTGTTLAPLPDPSGWLVIVVPKIDLAAKTATLYSMISPEDYSDGTMVQHVVDALVSGSAIRPESLANAFTRPLRKLIPHVDEVARIMGEAGCSQIALSGAGPAHYSIFESESEAREAEDRLKCMLRSHDYVVAAPFRHVPLAVSAG